MNSDWSSSTHNMSPTHSRPPGLRGREIGMYYRNLSERRKKEQGDQPLIKLGASVSVPPGVQNLVNECLQEFLNVHADIQEKIAQEYQAHFHQLLKTSFDEFLKEAKQQPSELSTERENELSEHFKTDLMAKKAAEEFQTRFEKRNKLPAMKQRTDILEAVQKNQVVLIIGSTGCGKTTQVPQMLLDDYINQGRGALCQIVCTQPRRISAISVAERVAYERCEKVGYSVGYQIRLESQKPRSHGCVLYCTSGILLQKMQSDPLLLDVNIIILDEIHERSIETDILMGLLKKILPCRPDLKLILMSATVSEDVFYNYFDKCCTLNIEGTLFPVDVLYLEDILQETRYNKFEGTASEHSKHGRHGKQRHQKSIQNKEYSNMIDPYLRHVRNNYDTQVLQALRSADSEGCANMQFLEFLIFYICENKPPGAILVFLPGYDKISKLSAALQNPTQSSGRHAQPNIKVYPLHSMMPTVNQQSVFLPAPKGVRKVILSTIIAETSVTIEDVVYVINTGRIKTSNYDLSANIQTLEECWVTKANSQQRRGRAGRIQPGVCYNLFTRAREDTMADIPTPEILRSKLESVILSLKLLYIKDISEFLNSLIDAPKPEAIQNGLELLRRINALDDKDLLTPLGMHLARLPVDPQMGKMLIMAALFRCMDPITSVAAGMSFKSPFYTPLGQEKKVDHIKVEMAANSRSDHLLIHNALLRYSDAVEDGRERNFCYNFFLSLPILQQLHNMKQQFSSLLLTASFLESSSCSATSSNVNSGNIPLLRAIIAAGLYPNMAHLRKARTIKNRVNAIHSMSTPEERRVNFHPSSVNNGISSFDSQYFVYFQKQKSTATYLLDATMVYPMSLIIFGDNIHTGLTPQKEFYICVAKAYYFKCDERTAEMLQQLRQCLESLLQKKALYPSPIARNSHEECLIKAIQILLSLDEACECEDQYLLSD